MLLSDLPEVLLVDLPSFLDDEPDLAFVVDDLEVEPVVDLLPVELLFGDELELPVAEVKLPDELFFVLSDVDEVDDVGLELLEEPPDILLDVWSEF
ncbi:hypothetical protein PKOR_09110 [Pontibacter korlensis]|uniref:Uncharacterized protein n=1 Tax=Pontibacter korlensis TaxID=400092 RepID=A0A0E3ZF16_9BACT|nr:hypothetical protein [Pontibacter korlensis]AKD03258.1 hypothetical protein PKOR_09110 [Pontibacter korlensis]